MRRPHASNLAVLALIAACGGKVLTDAGSGSTGSQGGGQGSTGSGSVGSSSSGSVGSSSGAVGSGPGPGSSGSGTVTGGGVACGVAACAPGSECCNPACGICVPVGSICPEISCGSAGASGVGGAFVGAGGAFVGAGGAFIGTGGPFTGAGGSGAPGCVAAPPRPSAVVVSTNLSDLESGILIGSVVPGGGWFSYKDSEPGTAFVPDPAAFTTESPGLNGTGHAVHVYGKGFQGPPSATNWGGGVGMALSVAGPTISAPTDFSAFRGISFWAKSGSISSDISVQISTTDTDPNYCTCLNTGSCYATHAVLLSHLPPFETKYTIQWSDLKQPPYVPAPIPFDPSHVLNIIFATNGPVPVFDYWVDEISLVK